MDGGGVPIRVRGLGFYHQHFLEPCLTTPWGVYIMSKEESNMPITRIINDLEQLPMEGGNSASDQAIQAFLDYLYERLDNKEKAA